MTQPQMTTNASQTNGNPVLNGNGASEKETNAKTREPKVLSAIEAATKISKILDQLANPADRKRVIAFLAESNE